MVGRPAGQPKSGGRKKGTPNKVSGSVKQDILDALHEAGGKEYLLAVAKDDPKTFLTLVGKIVPTELKADVNINPLEALLDEIDGETKGRTEG